MENNRYIRSSSVFVASTTASMAILYFFKPLWVMAINSKDHKVEFSWILAILYSMLFGICAAVMEILLLKK